MYELQRHELNPHAHKEELTKNRTYHAMRWKGIAQSSNLLELTPFSTGKDDYRIVDLDTLRVL